MTALLSIGAWLLKNPAWLLVIALGVFAGFERIEITARDLTIANRDTTIAQKDSALKGMQAQQEANIAAAQKAARDAMQADLDRTNALVRDLQADKDALQEKQNAAEVAVAAVPVAPDAPGCPDPMSLPVVRAFSGSLPDR